jgi:hypothetical protein
MQQTTRDGVDQINVATNSPANFSRWHPALTGADWTGLNCTGLQCTPLGMTAAAGMIANKSRRRQTASAPAHFSVSTPLALCPLRSSFRYVSSLLLARAGHENAVLGLCATAPSDRVSERLVSRDDTVEEEGDSLQQRSCLASQRSAAQTSIVLASRRP